MLILALKGNTPVRGAGQVLHNNFFVDPFPGYKL